MSGIINSAGSRSGVIGTTELDYEEGYHTYVVNTSDENAWTVRTSVARYTLGSYTKIGRLVHYGGGIELDATAGKSDGGTVRISMPFACASLDEESDSMTGSCLIYNISGLSSSYNTIIKTIPGESYFVIIYTNGSGADTHFATGTFTHTSAWEFRFQLTYPAEV